MKAAIIFVFTLLLALPVFSQHYVLQSDRPGDGVFRTHPRQTPKWFIQTKQILVLRYDAKSIVARLLDINGRKIKDVILDDYASLKNDTDSYTYVKYHKSTKNSYNKRNSARLRAPYWTRLERNFNGRLTFTLGKHRGRVIGYQDMAMKFMVEKSL